MVEEIAGQWLLDLLSLPPQCSFALVTGGQMANTTALAAARHHVLAQAGWDVEAAGLTGAPAVRLIVSDEAHVTIPRAARLLGLGTRAIVSVATDANGAMRPSALADALADGGDRPTIVCCQAGNVNTGASTGRGVRSGNNGVFLIEGIAIGEARTQATATGYANDTKTLDMLRDTVYIYEMRPN